MKITKENFEIIAKSLGYKVIAEYKFLTDRKFRADWLINEKILIEYEGVDPKAGYWTIKNGKRIYVIPTNGHTSITGYTKDCEKYNLAQIHGFIVLRYTALNFNNVFNDLDLLNKKE